MPCASPGGKGHDRPSARVRTGLKPRAAGRTVGPHFPMVDAMDRTNRPAVRAPGERRSGEERRTQGDRREEFRFELGKGNRRQRNDRRAAEPWDGRLSR